MTKTKGEVLERIQTVEFRQAINAHAVAEKAEQISRALGNGDHAELVRLGARMAALADRTQVLAQERASLEARRDAIEQTVPKEPTFTRGGGL